MRKLAGFAAIAAIAFGATAVMAASPTPSASPRPSATPSTRPAPSATPAPSASPTPSVAPKTRSSTAAAAADTWTAAVEPVQTSGSVTIHRLKGGDGTLTFKVNDLLDGLIWNVRLERGAIERAIGGRLIASRSGEDVHRFTADTISIRLSKTEMSAFMAARKSVGVTALISDGSRLSFAGFPKG